jgi:uncharacterized FAD-dependent dehydrogenase
MQKKLSLQLTPEEAADPQRVRKAIAASCGLPATAVTGHHLLRSSIDARGRQTWMIQQVLAFLNEPYTKREVTQFTFQEVHHAVHQVLIVGAGPAGLFAALKLIENGIRPILLERGKDVRARRRDLARINKEGVVDPDSNYCFGEGGAGTYSDGKLYTRSTKRGDVNRILQLFYRFGAAENILYEAHPHIGTNKLPQIITALREQILSCGGIIHFEQRVAGIQVKDGKAKGIRLSDGSTIEGDAVILATGHSARDIFRSLAAEGIPVQAKPFALGVRIEHPQVLIDRAQYHCLSRSPYLPPAAYSLVTQVAERGVFSFCMCPGGIIAPAATSPGEIVVNGWSPSKRNNPFANSGMVVTIEPEDFSALNEKFGALSALQFQQEVEQKAFAYGGGQLKAPAQRMTDFITKKTSTSLPKCSYLPGLTSAPLNEVLPGFVYEALSKGFQDFGKKIKGYLTEEAVVVATESRTSSPVRIPRDAVSLEHPTVHRLYPCGEGAGYAGGIISAAMDGERVAEQLIRVLK